MENVYKRFSRAKFQLKKTPLHRWDLDNKECTARLPILYQILYLIFSEGYLSVNNKFSVRIELCEEAIRLATLLAENEIGQRPELFALLALMHLQIARTGGRQDDTGGLLLLEEQDRTKWDSQRIGIGLNWLKRWAQGGHFSRFHAEAGVAAEHCMASSFENTRWDKIIECYTILERTTPSAIHRLNRAVAVAEWQGPEADLKVLQEIESSNWLSNSYSWCAVMADLHQRCGEIDAATECKKNAIDIAPTAAVKTILERRLNRFS